MMSPFGLAVPDKLFSLDGPYFLTHLLRRASDGCILDGTTQLYRLPAQSNSLHDVV
jgi:hypothetical protein